MRPPMGGGRFRGRGGRDGGGGRGRGGGGRYGGGGGRNGFRDEGPPSEVVEVSTFLHACEGEAVTKLCQEKIPQFNAPIYLQNMTQIGKVEEIFGPINESMFSMKLMEGIVATSYKPGDKFYINPVKLMHLSRFLPQPKGAGGPRGGGSFRARGGPRGGSSFRGRGPPRGGGSFRGGRGPPRGGRGGFRGSRGRGF